MLNKAELIFKAIDIFGEVPQNAVRFPGIVRVKDISYSDISAEFTVGDLYFKRSILHDGKKHPVILYIHGGGFIMGDKDYRVTNSEFFAHHGFFVFNINHRMPPDVVLPDNINDCIDALDYLKTLSEQYNIDLDKVIISGDSSGAYESSMVAASRFDERLCQTLKLHTTDVKVSGLALMCGIYDLNKLLEGPTLFGVVPETASMILGLKLEKDMSNINEYEYIDYISPVNFVNKNWCPTFITWAQDDIICIDQGVPMSEKLKANCPKYSDYFVKGIQNNHCYHLNMRTKLAKECMNKCVSFLEDALEIEDLAEKK